MNAVLVNKDDEVIGSKALDQIRPSDIYRVTGLWLTNSRGQILIAQRQLGKRNDPGKWGPAVSGTVEPGETYESNIYKEAEEEIGLRGFEFSLGAKVLNDANRVFFVQWFTCAADWPIEKFKIRKEEVEQLQWTDKATLVKQLDQEPGKFTAGAKAVWESFLK